MIIAGNQAFDSLRVGGQLLRLPRFIDSNTEGLIGWSIANANPLGTETELIQWYDYVLLRRNGCFLDVGTNFGQTLVRVLSLDFSRAYVGFEPNIQCCSYVDALIFFNSLPNHRVLPTGLSNAAGVRSLHVRDRHQPGEIMGTSTTVCGFRPQEFYTTTRTITIAKGDDLVSQMGLERGGIAAIKIDVEGAEDEVVEGLFNTLQRFRPPVFLEVLPNFIVATQQRLSESAINMRADRLSRLNTMLDRLGYRSFMIHGNGSLRVLDRLSPPETQDLSMTNHLSVPCEDAQEYEGR